MTKILYDWMKNLVFYYIFLSVIMHIIPNADYRKYIRFFMGIILMLLLASPVLSILKNKEVLSTNILRRQLEEADKQEQLWMFAEEDSQKTALKAAYETQLARQVKENLEKQSISCEAAQVFLNEDLHIIKIEIWFKDTISQEEKGEIKQQLANSFEISETSISIWES